MVFMLDRLVLDSDLRDKMLSDMVYYVFMLDRLVLDSDLWDFPCRVCV